MTPLVFLDFDGVICTQGSYRRWTQHERKAAYAQLHPDHVWHNDGADMIDVDLLANVQALCAEVSAEVVISSSWRNLYDMAQLRGMLERRKFTTPIIGRTPYGPASSRGAEILEWLIEERGWPRQSRGPWPDQRIVVLEDNEDIRPLRRFQVMTTFEGPRAGFTKRHLLAARRILEAARA